MENHSKTTTYNILQNLPSMPGVTSSCEAELFKLMTDIDLVVSKKYQEWKQELDTVNSALESQTKENTYLKAALKNCQCEIDSLKKQISAFKHPHSERTAMHEVPKQTQQAVSDKHNIRTEQFRHGEENPQVLLKIIADLKLSLNEKDRLLMTFKKNEENMMSEIENLHAQMQQQPLKLVSDQTSVDKLITNASETMWKQEAVYREKLRQSISEDIDRLGQKLESTTFHL